MRRRTPIAHSAASRVLIGAEPGPMPDLEEPRSELDDRTISRLTDG